MSNQVEHPAFVLSKQETRTRDDTRSWFVKVAYLTEETVEVDEATWSDAVVGAPWRPKGRL